MDGFFLVSGKNPLFIYLLSDLVVVPIYMVHVSPGQNLHNWVNTEFFQAFAHGATGSFLFAVVFMLVCWSIGLRLDKNRIYVRV